MWELQVVTVHRLSLCITHFYCLQKYPSPSTLWTILPNFKIFQIIFSSCLTWRSAFWFAFFFSFYFCFQSSLCCILLTSRLHRNPSVIKWKKRNMKVFPTPCFLSQGQMVSQFSSYPLSPYVLTWWLLEVSRGHQIGQANDLSLLLQEHLKENIPNGSFHSQQWGKVKRKNLTHFSGTFHNLV